MHEVNWRSVFPAVPTQFREDFSLDLMPRFGTLMFCLKQAFAGS